MVYIGKPSTGCSNCRTMKKKVSRPIFIAFCCSFKNVAEVDLAVLECDHGVPSCGRCLRKGAVCGGYRDKLDLTFRDQTRQTIHKSNQAKHKVKSPVVATQLVGNPMEAKSPSQLDESKRLITPALSVPITDQAVSFFFFNFVLTDPISGGGHLEYLPVIYDGITRDLALPTAIVAIGMAGIANLRRNRDLLLAANAQYVLAIQLTQAALIDETLRIQDQTLVSILLLALYEVSGSLSGLMLFSRLVNKQRSLDNSVLLATITAYLVEPCHRGNGAYFSVRPATTDGCCWNTHLFTSSLTCGMQLFSQRLCTNYSLTDLVAS